MAYRDDDEARAARIAALEANAAEAEDLREKLRTADEKNRALEAKVAELTPPGPLPAPPELPKRELPPFDLGDPRITAAQDAKDWMSVCALCEEHTAHADRAHRIAALSRLGVTREDELRDVHGAAEAYDRALAIDPCDDFAFARIAACHTVVEDWFQLAAVLERRAEAERDPAVRAEIFARLGYVRLEKLAYAPDAADSFRAALELDPENTTAAAGLRAATLSGSR